MTSDETCGPLDEQLSQPAHPVDRPPGPSMRKIVIAIAVSAVAVVGLLLKYYSDVKIAGENRARVEQGIRDLCSAARLPEMRLATDPPNTAFKDALAIIFQNPSAETLIRARYKSDAPAILSIGQGLAGSFDETVRQIDDDQRRYKEIQKRLDVDAADLAVLRAKAITRSYLIIRRFDTDASGRGIYEALDQRALRKVVLIADTNHVSEIPGMIADLCVEDRGEQEYSMHHWNAYQNFDSKEYIKTVEENDVRSRLDSLEHQVLQERSEFASRTENNSLYDRCRRARNDIQALAILLDDRHSGQSFATAGREVIEGREEGSFRFADMVLERRNDDSGTLNLKLTPKRSDLTLENAKEVSRSFVKSARIFDRSTAASGGGVEFATPNEVLDFKFTSRKFIAEILYSSGPMAEKHWKLFFSTRQYHVGGTPLVS